MTCGKYGNEILLPYATTIFNILGKEYNKQKWTNIHIQLITQSGTPVTADTKTFTA